MKISSRAQTDSVLKRGGNVMDESIATTEVMNIRVFVERIAALWKEEGFPVQMDSSASVRLGYVMEAFLTVMMGVMNIPLFVEQIVALYKEPL